MKSGLQGAIVWAALMGTGTVCAMLLDGINEQDDKGRTLVHHCMMHNDMTVERMALLLKIGGRLDIKDYKGEDPYLYGITNQGMSPLGELEGPYFYNTKVVNFVHSTLLTRKLRWVAFSERFKMRHYRKVLPLASVKSKRLLAKKIKRAYLRKK